MKHGGNPSDGGGPGCSYTFHGDPRETFRMFFGSDNPLNELFGGNPGVFSFSTNMGESADIGNSFFTGGSRFPVCILFNDACVGNLSALCLESRFIGKSGTLKHYFLDINFYTA